MVKCILVSHMGGKRFDGNALYPRQGRYCLADQVKSLYWQSRKVKCKGKAPKEVVTETLAKVHAPLAFERVR